MAVQELESKEAQGEVGITRSINSAATGMIMDIVQAGQYTKPIQSCVRELVSNSVDSQSEKLRALSILSKESKVEDFFIEREGDLYKDSKWDPSYYDTKHLNKADNEVIITYKQREGSGRCDSFIVRDNGVGLGGSRLEGALTSVGYSTKRNRVDALGSYGLGSKVGLATGADYYKVTTVYNGVKYICQVYNRKLVSLTPEFNLDKECENEKLVFSNGVDIIYGEKTDELNYCEIEVPCMKHHKSEYEYAVKTQLMYFPGLRFFVEREDESTHEIEFGADILHNSDNIVISSNSPYTKPHVIIVKGGVKGSDTGVCYGELDFSELELEEMRGAVGIKCPIRQVIVHDDGSETVLNDGVDVISSRESVRWSANTKAFIKKQFEIAQLEATNIVEKELQQENFTEWLKACINIYRFANNRNSALYHLSKIVNMDNLKPRYKFSKVNIIYQSFAGMFCTFDRTRILRDSVKKDDKIISKRVDVGSWSEVNIDNVILMNPESRFNRLSDLYIAYLNSGSAVVLKPFSDTDLKELARKLNIKVDILRDEQKELIRLLDIPQERNYDNFEPTDDFIKSLETTETADIKVKEPTPEEIRKRESRTICHTLVPRYASYYEATGETYKMDKQEPKIGDIADYKGKLFYGKMSDASQLQFAAHILDRSMQSIYDGVRFYNGQYRLVVVAESNIKHFKTHSKIEDLFRKFVPVEDENKKIIGVNIEIDMNIVAWYTAKKVYEELNEKLDFLNNFSNFNQEISEDYKELVSYARKHYVNMTAYHNRTGMSEFYKPFLDFMSKVEKLQETVETETDKSLIADKVAELVLPVGVTSGIAVDREVLNKLNKVLDYANPIKALLNQVTILSREGYEIPTEVGMQIQEFLELKQR